MEQAAIGSLRGTIVVAQERRKVASSWEEKSWQDDAQ